MISIITVSFNASSTIEKTIRSVAEQKFPDIEHIVVDGGSTDGTLEILHSHQDRLTRYISEPDEGVSDAMNKGLEMASGGYVLYLNADDYLTDTDSIGRIASCSGTDLVAAPIIKRERDERERLVRPRGFNWWLNFKTGLFHQATLCARSALVDLGGFDKTLELTMDYDLFLRAYRKGCTIRITDKPFSVMRSGGISTRNDTRTLRRRLAEEETIHYRHCPNTVMRIAYKIYWRVYPLYRLSRSTKE